MHPNRTPALRALPNSRETRDSLSLPNIENEENNGFSFYFLVPRTFYDASQFPPPFYPVLIIFHYRPVSAATVAARWR